MRHPPARDCGSGAAQASVATTNSSRRLITGYDRLFRSDDIEQLDVENEGGAAGNRRASLIAIGEVRGADQHRFSAHFHALDAFGPAFDHTVERELSALV